MRVQCRERIGCHFRRGGADSAQECRFAGIGQSDEAGVSDELQSKPKCTLFAGQAGIDEAYGDLLPDQKIEKVRSLAQSHGGVGMIGDGVNDAPALAAATVGFAIGKVFVICQRSNFVFWN